MKENFSLKLHKASFVVDFRKNVWNIYFDGDFMYAVNSFFAVRVKMKFAKENHRKVVQGKFITAASYKMLYKAIDVLDVTEKGFIAVIKGIGRIIVPFAQKQDDFPDVVGLFNQHVAKIPQPISEIGLMPFVLRRALSVVDTYDTLRFKFTQQESVILCTSTDNRDKFTILVMPAKLENK